MTEKIVSNFVLGVDLDGVCADFIEGIRPIAAQWLGKHVDELAKDVSYGFPEWGLTSVGGPDPDEAYGHLHRYAITQRNLFENLPIVDRAGVVLRSLAHTHNVRIRIITHRLFVSHFHETAIQQTVSWLDRHDIPYYDMCFMKDKAAVGADLYIEDSPTNIVALREAGKHVVIFTNSMNRHVPGKRADTWNDVERLVLEEVARWKSDGGEKRGLAGI